MNGFRQIPVTMAESLGFRGDEAVPVAISACLLGEPVRYDGRDKSWSEAIACARENRAIRLVPLCPEVGCGLGVPREPMRLEGDPDCPRAMTITSRIDQTERLQAWSERCVAELVAGGVRGFLLKSRSPSCGVNRVPVHDSQGVPRPVGMGLFAGVCRRRFPGLPLVEGDPALDRTHLLTFLERVRSVGIPTGGEARSW
ncbi:MAG: DUF523 domain-containing protein [Magnetococcales bacterium]|nr:DUF523 domain-containing protein [Magnetococcales bacterium]